MKHKSIIFFTEALGDPWYHLERRIQLFEGDSEFVTFYAFETKKEAKDLQTKFNKKMEELGSKKVR